MASFILRSFSTNPENGLDIDHLIPVKLDAEFLSQAPCSNSVMMAVGPCPLKLFQIMPFKFVLKVRKFHEPTTNYFRAVTEEHEEGIYAPYIE